MALPAAGPPPSGTVEAPAPLPAVPIGAPAPPAPLPPLTPVPPPPRKSRGIALVAVAVAVVVVLGVLVFAGVFSPSGGGTGRVVGTPVPYSRAVALAASLGLNTSGGPWTVVAGEGLRLPSGVAQLSDTSVGGTTCTFTPPPGAPSVATVPGTPLGAGAGDAADWVFFAKNASLQTILLVNVEDGQAFPMSFVTGCSTVSTFAALGAVSATSVVDSTTVASTFDQVGGSSFLHNDSTATQLYVLVGPSPSTGSTAFWDVLYSTCAFTATSGSGSWLSAYYDAGSGTLVSGPTPGSGICGS